MGTCWLKFLVMRSQKLDKLITRSNDTQIGSIKENTHLKYDLKEDRIDILISRNEQYIVQKQVHLY
jgi:hypothetical protein